MQIQISCNGRRPTVMNVKTKLRAALSSLMDSAAAASSARSILSDIETAVARGTDRHDSPADDKYVHEILFLVSNSPGSITFLARTISRRLERARDSIVTLKSLLLLHRLLRGGDRYFEQDIHNLWSSGELRIGLNRSEHSCSFIAGYAEFTKERMEWIINQSGKLEPARPPGLEVQACEENAEELVLHRLSKCQAFLDRVMDCLPSSIWYSSRVAHVAVNMILKESFLVYESFSDWFEIAVSSFFNLKKPMRVLALDIMKKASTQTAEIDEYYKRCRRSIVGKGLEYPDVRIVTADEVTAFEHCSYNYLASTEAGISREEQEKEGRFLPFSSKLETKIRTVWVEFSEDDSPSSVFSIGGGLKDRLAGFADDVAAHGESSAAGKAMRSL